MKFLEKISGEGLTGWENCSEFSRSSLCIVFREKASIRLLGTDFRMLWFFFSVALDTGVQFKRRRWNLLSAPARGWHGRLSLLGSTKLRYKYLARSSRSSCVFLLLKEVLEKDSSNLKILEKWWYYVST